MTAEPNVFDVITGALIAQAQSFAVLVRLLEDRDVLHPGTTREALEALIEALGDGTPFPQRHHLNEILKQLELLPPLPPARRP